MYHLSANFRSSEFFCRCGCNQGRVRTELVVRLQAIRDRIGQPIIIVSGYRCPAHNMAVGGHPQSYHTHGMAADIRCPSVTLSTLYSICERNSPPGLGTYPEAGHIHIDEGRRYQRWTYREGKYIYMF